MVTFLCVRSLTEFCIIVCPFLQSCFVCFQIRYFWVLWYKTKNFSQNLKLALSSITEICALGQTWNCALLFICDLMGTKLVTRFIMLGCWGNGFIEIHKRQKKMYYLVVSVPKFCLIYDLPSCLLNYSFLDYPFEYYTSVGLREGIEFYTWKALWVILILLNNLSQFYFCYLCHIYCLGSILEFSVCFNEVFWKFSIWKFPDS